jgi:hypothetical protein
MEGVAIKRYDSLSESAAGGAYLHNFAARNRSDYYCPAYVVSNLAGGKPSWARELKQASCTEDYWK